TIRPSLKEAEALRKRTSRSLPRRYSWLLFGLILFSAAIAFTVFYWRAGKITPASADRNSGTAIVTNSKLYSQMSEAEQLDFVDQQEQRISMMMGDRPVKLNGEAVRVIKSYVDRYAARDHASTDLGSESIDEVYA